MARRSYRPEQIINKLREAEVLLCQGSTVGVTEQTYYRWRKKHSGIGIQRNKRLNEYELAKLDFWRGIGAMFQSRTCKPSL